MSSAATTRAFGAAAGKGMKIYFCGSIRAGRQDVDLYANIVGMLEKYGSVLTPFVADKSITVTGSEHAGGDKGIHDRDVALLQQSDAIVAEVTQPSLGVGYEIGRAFDMKKPILCLYRPQPEKLLSAMIRGMHDGGMYVVQDYQKAEDLTQVFESFFAVDDAQNAKE